MPINSFSRGTFAITGLVLFGCAHAPTTTAVSTPAADVDSTFEMSAGLHWMRDSAEYRALVNDR